MKEKVKSCIADINQLKEGVKEDDMFKGAAISNLIRALMAEDEDTVAILSDVAGRFVKRHLRAIIKAGKIGERLGSDLAP